MRPLSLIGFTVLSIAFVFPSAFSEEFDPELEATIVWAGDSITHQCGYTQYLENFLYTRFHDKNLRFSNAGIKGDRASDLLDRFDEDVAKWNPQYVTLLLGMNDGRYLELQRENFAVYQRDMNTILERLSEIGARSIILSPTMFDHHQYTIRNEEADFRFKRLNAHSEYNAKLAYYGGWLREVARGRNLEYIDLWGPMNDLTARFRRTDSTATLLPDSIHPDPNGMALIAVEMAKYFAGNRREANRVSLIFDGQEENVIEGNVVVKRFDRNGVEAIVTPQSLPWTLHASDKVGPAPWNYFDDPHDGFGIALADQSLNRDILTVSGLDRGHYEVRMDGEFLFTTDQDSLILGIELQTLNTPAYRQSKELARLNARRNDIAVRPYRDVQGKMKGARRKFVDDPAGFAAIRLSVERELNALYQTAIQLEDQIHELAIPRPYRLEIRRVK